MNRKTKFWPFFIKQRYDSILAIQKIFGKISDHTSLTEAPLKSNQFSDRSCLLIKNLIRFIL